MSKRIGIVSDVVVVVMAGFLVFIFFHFRRAPWHQGSSMAQLHPGTVLPPILGPESSSRGTILILAIQSGCDICEDSMPFFKRLLELKAAGRIPVRIIAVMPNPPGVAEKFVSSHGLSLPVVPDANLALAHVPGTPTMILVDAKRTVQRVWVGEQSRVEQATDIAELESLAGTSASPQRGETPRGRPQQQPLDIGGSLAVSCQLQTPCVEHRRANGASSKGYARQKRL